MSDGRTTPGGTPIVGNSGSNDSSMDDSLLPPSPPAGGPSRGGPSRSPPVGGSPPSRRPRVDRLYDEVIVFQHPVVPEGELAEINVLVSALLQANITEQLNHYRQSAIDLSKAVAYVGLKVKEMRQALVFYAKRDYGDDYLKPIYSAIIIGLMRGNNIDRIIDTTGPPAKAIVSRVKGVFSLASKAGKDPNVITLVRIMICFPEITARVATMIHPPGVVADIDEFYPHAMRNSSFASLIPKRPREGQVGDADMLDNIKHAHYLYQARTSMQLDRKVKRIDASVIERQRSFVHTGINQGTSSEETRWRIILDPEYSITVDGVLNPLIISAANECKRILSLYQQ